MQGLLSIRNDLASRAAALSFVSNATLMTLKLTVGLLTGSVAVLSDGVDSAEDLFASTFAFLSIRLASQPADEEHPYGHGRAETMAAAAQALLIGAGGGFIIFQALRRLVNGDVEINTGPGLIAMAVTAAINVAVVLYVGRAARATGSPALMADTRHLWTNIAQAAAVSFGLALVAITGNHVFDPIVALALAAYLLWTASQLGATVINEVMDVRLPENEERLIVASVEASRDLGALGYHDLRTRKSGRQRYVEFHLLVDSQQTVAAAHELSEAVERGINECLPGAIVTVHVDPHDASAQS
jgi:cation diffusion facilitator family transporter